MKGRIIFLFFLFLFIRLNSNAQNDSSNFENYKGAVTIGVLQGGGSLIGLDIEKLLIKNVGLQLGLGMIGFGGGINFHFKPAIKSPFITIGYWHQGIGKSFTQDIIGMTYVYRAKKWFTFQIGGGFPLSKGPAYPESIEQPPFMLLYSIGAYFTMY